MGPSRNQPTITSAFLSVCWNLSCSLSSSNTDLLTWSALRSTTARLGPDLGKYDGSLPRWHLGKSSL
jgi:hypothetical protein